MLTEVDICNLALSRIGQRAIDTLSENSAEASSCARHYDIARDSLLRAYWWNFAKASAALSQNAEDPAEWAYSYDLPVDLIAVRYAVPPVRFGRHRINYELAAGVLWTDEAEISLIYTKQIIDPESFDKLFVRALFHRLAADLVGPLTLDPRKSAIEEQMFLTALAEARAADAIEETPFDINDMGAAWLEARG